MNLNENYIWFNQKYFYYKDTTFNPNGGSMEIIATCNSKDDLQSFSPPMLNVSIFNEGLRYNINLKYQDVIDLLDSIDIVQNNISTIYNDKKSPGINKLYNGKNLKILFKISQNTGSRAVMIFILNNITDYGLIIVPYAIIFSSIVELLNTFKHDYINVSFNISNRVLMSQILDELRCIKGSVKTIPSSIVSINSTGKLEENVDIPKDENPNSIKNEFQEGFDKFMKENIDNIQIPDLSKIVNEDKKPEKTESILVDDILRNDIGVFDSLLTSINTCDNPIEKLKDIFKDYFGDLDLLPGINDDELKSASYYSKLFFSTNLQNYIRNNVQIPVGIPIVKYPAINISPKNIDLAYDLLTISIYVKLVREKLQTRIDDATINKSILYMSLRNYTDIFTFSFLDEIDITKIVNCISDKFAIFSKSGFFARFDELLANYNLQKVMLQDIRNFLPEALSKIIGSEKAVYICELQEKDYLADKIKLHPKNELALDQIGELTFFCLRHLRRDPVGKD